MSESFAQFVSELALLHARSKRDCLISRMENLNYWKVLQDPPEDRGAQDHTNPDPQATAFLYGSQPESQKPKSFPQQATRGNFKQSKLQKLHFKGSATAGS